MTATKRALKQACLGDDTGCVCMPSRGKLLLRYTSSNLGTRQATKALLDGLNPWHLSATDQGKNQVALVEILNNIVKHAYGDQGGGIIEITCRPSLVISALRSSTSASHCPITACKMINCPLSIFRPLCPKAGLAGS